MAYEYVCSSCGESCMSNRPDDEALAEMAANFPGATRADCAIICEDCYQALVSAGMLKPH